MAGPLSYLGTGATRPPNFFEYTRIPTEDDVYNFSIGDIWLHVDDTVTPNNPRFFILTGIISDTATWTEIIDHFDGDYASTFLTDVGSASPINNFLNVIGSTNTRTTGADDTITVHLKDTLTIIGNIATTNGKFIANNGDLTVRGAMETTLGSITAPGNITSANGSISASTGLVTVSGGTTIDVGGIDATGTIIFNDLMNTYGGVVQSTSAGELTTSYWPENGYILISSSIGPPEWRRLTAGDQIAIAEGHNSIIITEVGTILGAVVFHTDIFDAITNGNEITFEGGSNITTVGLGSTVTVNLDGTLSIAGSCTTATGLTATTIGLTVSTGGGNITGDVDILTGNISTTNGGVIAGDGLNVVAGSLVITAGDLDVTAGDISVFGGVDAGNGLIATSGGLTVTGATILNDLTTEGVLQVDASQQLFADDGTGDGQVLISSAAGPPVWANITSSDGSFTINNGANSIDLVVT